MCKYTSTPLAVMVTYTECVERHVHTMALSVDSLWEGKRAWYTLYVPTNGMDVYQTKLGSHRDVT